MGMVGQPPGTYPHACDWETIGDLARRFPTSGRRAAPAGGAKRETARALQVVTSRGFE
jgi:hypothetical protein